MPAWFVLAPQINIAPAALPFVIRSISVFTAGYDDVCTLPASVSLSQNKSCLLYLAEAQGNKSWLAKKCLQFTNAAKRCVKEELRAEHCLIGPHKDLVLYLYGILLAERSCVKNTSK